MAPRQEITRFSMGQLTEPVIARITRHFIARGLFEPGIQRKSHMDQLNPGVSRQSAQRESGTQWVLLGAEVADHADSERFGLIRLRSMQRLRGLINHMDFGMESLR